MEQLYENLLQSGKVAEITYLWYRQLLYASIRAIGEVITSKLRKVMNPWTCPRVSFSGGTLCSVIKYFRRFSSTKENQKISSSVTSAESSKSVADVYKSVMRKVPQPVVVVTTSEYDTLKDSWSKRGMTCTSFTSVSFDPSVVSICIKNTSRMHDLLLRTQHFAVHVLAKDQVKYGVYFSEPVKENICQFASIPHELGDEGVPLISGCSAVIQCKAHSVNTVGDHYVWYGSVHDASLNQEAPDPLLYFIRSFRSVGDEIFLKAFEDATLPFEDWTHKAHLRMAWNYITEHGKEGAVPYIRNGIQHFNEQNKDRLKFHYHETITMFYISVVTDAINRSKLDADFEDFITTHSYLLDRNLPAKFYTKERLFCSEATHTFVSPDKGPLPS